MFIAFDIITFVLIISMVISGYKNGIANSVIRFASSIVTLLGAYVLAAVIAQGVYNLFLKQTILDSISGAMKISTDSFEFFNNIPSFLAGIINLTSSAGKLFENAQRDIENAVQTYVAPNVIMFIRLVIFPLLLIIISLALKPVVKILSGIFKLPLIDTLDKLLGAAVAVPIAVVFVSVLIGILLSVSNHFDAMKEYFSPDIINKTIIFRYFYGNGIVRFVYGLFG